MINRKLADFSKKEFGIIVLNGSFEDADCPDNFFDMVTFINVLEHLQDPDIGLKGAYRVLCPGGAIFL